MENFIWYLTCWPTNALARDVPPTRLVTHGACWLLDLSSGSVRARAHADPTWPFDRRACAIDFADSFYIFLWDDLANYSCLPTFVTAGEVGITEASLAHASRPRLG